MIRPAIIVGGGLVDCEAAVYDWTATGMHFAGKSRTKETRYVICHWTGSENAPRDVWTNMQKRKVSVHFIVAQNGDVYQCCDTDQRCSHAAESGGNDHGVGIEFISRGHDTKVPTKGIAREVRTETIHKRRVQYGSMTPSQVSTAIALTSAICRAYRLPTSVPIDVKTRGIYASVLPPLYLETFRGILGHFHLDANKVDPGLDLLRRLDRAFQEPPPLDVA